MPPTASLSGSSHQLNAVEWAYESGRFVAFAHDFGVRAMEPALGRYVDQVFGGLAAPGEPTRWYSFVDRGPTAAARYALYFEGGEQHAAPTALSTMSRLLWHVNRSAIASCSDRVVIHAAAAEHEGRALLFPACMGAGKTTLVAGLVSDGLRYLTDEAAAIDPGTLHVEGLAKSLTINVGSWSALPELEPTLEPGAEKYVDRQWHVDVRTIRADALASSAEPGFVIVSRYMKGAPTRLAPLSRSHALLALCENAFNLGPLGQPGLDALAELVRRSSCHQLVVGVLREASALIFDLLADRTPKPSAVIPAMRDVPVPQRSDDRGVEGSFVPVPRRSVAWVEIEGETVVLQTSTGAVHHLDVSGSLIWACFDGTCSVDELVVRLSSAFDATPDRVRHDVTDFVRRLHQRALIES